MEPKREEGRVMEKLDPKINAWLKERLIPQLAVTFREKYNVVEDVEYKVTKPKGSFYLSDLFFVTIQFPGNSSSGEKSLLVKLPPQDSNVQKRQNYDALFDNEMMFYQKVAEGSSDYPMCYLCGKDPVFKKVIVLENVSPRGYFNCPSKINLPFDYLISGVQTIGRLHGHTYTLKELKPMKFHNIVNKIKNSRYKEVPDEITDLFAHTMKLRISRVTRSLQLRSSCDAILVGKVTRLFENCHSSVMKLSVKPREPLATIVHGDCTVNNILFRKRRTDGENEERRYEGMLVDFALIMYSSPATDVSTFLYMSGLRGDVKERFHELFKAYHDALTEYLKDQKIWDPVKYCYDAFLQDYKLSGFFGYIIATFFLPIMTEYAKDNSILDNPDAMIEEHNITGGGEVLTQLLVDMLFDAHEAGLLDYYINNLTD